MVTCIHSAFSFHSPQVEAWESVEWAWARDSCPLGSAPLRTLPVEGLNVEVLQTAALGIETADEGEVEAWAVTEASLDRLLRLRRGHTKVNFLFLGLFIIFINKC